MTITIGWWAIPALITLASLIWAAWPDRSQGFGIELVAAFQLLVAIIINLAAWLIWSLFA